VKWLTILLTSSTSTTISRDHAQETRFCPLLSKHRIVAIPGRLSCCEVPEDDCQMVLDHLTKFASRRQTVEVVIMANASSRHGQTTSIECGAAAAASTSGQKQTWIRTAPVTVY